MDKAGWVQRLRKDAGFPTDEDAEAFLLAIFEDLPSVIGPETAIRLSAVFPGELRRLLMERSTRVPRRILTEEFLDRLAAAQGTDRASSVAALRAFFQILHGEIGRDASHALLEHLPPELRTLAFLAEHT